MGEQAMEPGQQAQRKVLFDMVRWRASGGGTALIPPAISADRQTRLQALYDRSTETLAESLMELYQTAIEHAPGEMENTVRLMTRLARGHAHGEDAYHLNFGPVLDVVAFLVRCGLSEERARESLAACEAERAAEAASKHRKPVRRLP